MKKTIKTIFKKVKLKTLLLLIVLLMFNSYAWFIYATRVSGSITANIASWNISFQAGEEETTTNIEFKVDRIYPGMETYSETIRATNKGEMKAVLSYEIESVTILGTKYQVTDTTTSENLFNMIQNDFPFKINISADNTTLEAETGEAKITVTLEWPFESGDDITDTNWGERAYEYYAVHPGQTSVIVQMKIVANQQSEEQKDI